jgi:ribosome assembly protein 3
MSSVADGFKEDLEEIRKVNRSSYFDSFTTCSHAKDIVSQEPNLGTSRLALLIDSLASGADVFTSSSVPGSEINEMQLVLDPGS